MMPPRQACGVRVARTMSDLSTGECKERDATSARPPRSGGEEGSTDARHLKHHLWRPSAAVISHTHKHTRATRDRHATHTRRTRATDTRNRHTRDKHVTCERRVLKRWRWRVDANDATAAGVWREGCAHHVRSKHWRVQREGCHQRSPAALWGRGGFNRCPSPQASPVASLGGSDLTHTHTRDTQTASATSAVVATAAVEGVAWARSTDGTKVSCSLCPAECACVPETCDRGDETGSRGEAIRHAVQRNEMAACGFAHRACHTV